MDSFETWLRENYGPVPPEVRAAMRTAYTAGLRRAAEIVRERANNGAVIALPIEAEASRTDTPQREDMMIREYRYIVFKKKDLHNALTRDERGLLDYLCEKVNSYRERLGKQPLSCVVVESDWPEYEPTWEAIEKRVESDTP